MPLFYTQFDVDFTLLNRNAKQVFVVAKAELEYLNFHNRFHSEGTCAEEKTTLKVFQQFNVKSLSSQSTDIRLQLCHIYCKRGKLHNSKTWD